MTNIGYPSFNYDIFKQMFDQGEALKNIVSDFDEEKIKSLDLSNYKYISFATHAIVADQINNISEPGIILTPPKKSTEINDGILTVSEIEKLNLNSISRIFGKSEESRFIVQS